VAGLNVPRSAPTWLLQYVKPDWCAPVRWWPGAEPQFASSPGPEVALAAKTLTFAPVRAAVACASVTLVGPAGSWLGASPTQTTNAGSRAPCSSGRGLLQSVQSRFRLNRRRRLRSSRSAQSAPRLCLDPMLASTRKANGSTTSLYSETPKSALGARPWIVETIDENPALIEAMEGPMLPVVSTRNIMSSGDVSC